MEVRTKPELGMKHVEYTKDMRPKPAENPASLPGNADTDRLMRQFSRESGASRPSQAQDQFQVTGTNVDMVG